MGSVEKKIAALLTIVLVVLIGVYLAWGNKPTPAEQMQQQIQSATRAAAAAAPQQPGGAAGGPGCSTSPSASGAGAVKTQEFGKKGAKVEIVADLPITHGCHVQTEAQVKEAYKKFPNDVHLIIYDLFGPEGNEYAKTHGGKRAMVVINGQTTFDLGGKQVTFEYTEDRYSPNDIVPVVEQVVKGAS